MNDITSERLLFRELTFSDFDLWLPFHQDKKTSEFWSGLPKNPSDACQVDFNRTFYRYKNNLGGKCALIEQKTGNLIGLAGLLVQTVDDQNELEIAYSIIPEFWKKGYATEAAKQCKEFAIANKLAKSLISIIHIDNIPSQKVALNNGMKIDCKTTYHENPVFIFRITL